MMAQSLDAQPLVTIAIPCFNAENTIEGAIKSAQNQDWSNTEILIVDDASEDATIAIIEAFAKEDKRIRLICHETNQGTAVARNTLVENARGEFIAFFDADDVSYPERIRLQYQRLTHYEQEHKADLILCYAGRRVIPADGGEPYEKKGVGYKPPELVGQEFVRHHISAKEHKRSRRWGSYGSFSLFMRRAVFDLVGPFDPVLRRVQDTDYAMRAGLKGAHFISVNQTLIDWYINEADYKTDKKVLHYYRLMHRKYRYLLPNGFQYLLAWKRAKAILCLYMAISRGKYPLVVWYRAWFNFWHFMISPRTRLMSLRARLMPRTRFKRAFNRARNILRPFTRIRRARDRLGNIFRNSCASKGAIARRKEGE